MRFDHTKRLRHVIVAAVGLVVAVTAAIIGVDQGKPERLRLVEGQLPPAQTTTAPTTELSLAPSPSSPSTTPPREATTTVRRPVATTAPAPTPAPRATTTTTRSPAPRVGTFAMAPASGPAGSDVAVSGSGCRTGSVTVSMLPLAGSLPLDLAGADPRSDGTWSTTLTVPALALPGRYPVFAHCTGGGLLSAFDYDLQMFTVELPGD